MHGAVRHSAGFPVRLGCALLCLAVARAGAAEEAGRTLPPPLFPVELDAPFPEPQATFEEVKSLLEQHYYSDTLSSDALYRAAILGMLRHVSPPGDEGRAKLWPPTTHRRVEAALKGVRTDIGIRSRYAAADGAVTVTEVTPDSPAAGRLLAHDRIMRIDGQRLAGLTATAVEALLRGAPGKPLALTVVRDVEVIEVAIEPVAFEARDVVVGMLPEAIGYAAVRRVSAGVNARLRAEVDALVGDGARALVLDLRGNAGGVFAEALRIAELFVERGKPLLHTVRRGARIQSYVSSNAEPLGLETVVMVDRDTASASEIVARALADHDRALIVGHRTFGKAIMERTFPLANGFRTQFIVGALYGPSGRSWQGDGIVPDVVLQGPEHHVPPRGITSGADRLARDPPLKSAWQLLR